MEPGRGQGAVLTIRTVAETGSTNADLLALAGQVDEGFWLRAERQSAGRGRQGRAWVSPAGNFYGSTLVRLRASDPPAPGLALVAGVAVHDAVVEFLSETLPARGRPSEEPRGSTLQLKWPNDLIRGGAKLAGILLERAGDAVVVGIGVNLAHHPDGLDRPVTSLAAHTLAPPPEAFAQSLAAQFAGWLARWRGEGLAAIAAAWTVRAHPPGTKLAVALPDGRRAEGAFAGLDPDGALILGLADGGRHVIHAGDVFLI